MSITIKWPAYLGFPKKHATPGFSLLIFHHMGMGGRLGILFVITVQLLLYSYNTLNLGQHWGASRKEYSGCLEPCFSLCNNSRVESS